MNNNDNSLIFEAYLNSKQPRCTQCGRPFDQAELITPHPEFPDICLDCYAKFKEPRNKDVSAGDLIVMSVPGSPKPWVIWDKKQRKTIAEFTDKLAADEYLRSEFGGTSE